MAELNKAIAAKLWATMSVEVARFHPKLKRHPQSEFLGYADLSLTIPKLPGFALGLRGIEVKNLKGNPHLGFPSEQGADGEYYPKFFPKTGEMRAVLTTVIFADARVQQAIVDVAALVEADPDDEGIEGAQADAANPFND